MLGAIMVPHPPLIIPEVGRGAEEQIRETTEAYRTAAAWLVEKKPETVVLISPHSAMYRDYLHLSPGTGAQGSFGRFGASHIRLEASYDTELVQRISQDATAAGIPAGTKGERDAELDHGTLVPLYFLSRAAGGSLPFKLVRAGLSGLSYAEHYRFGSVIKAAAEALKRRFCVVASGDLSHYLRQDGPYGFRKEGPEYDARVMDIMGRAAFDELLALPEDACDQAGECGQRSFVMMAGCLDGLRVLPKTLSYQGITGVGYGVALFEPGAPDDARRFLDLMREKTAKQRKNESPYVQLARRAYEGYVVSGVRIQRPEGLPEEMLSRRAAVFVTLKKDGRLRGCIGTISPATGCIADEIISNAISAAARDPRFPAVMPEELPLLSCTVDVLEPPEDIDSPAALDVGKYGVIVTSGSKTGLLLPNLDGVDTVEEQLAIARRKAGIRKGQDARLQRFRVLRHR